VEGLTAVQADGVCSYSLVRYCSHSVVEGHQLSQAQLALGEAMLAFSHHLPVISVFRDVFQEDLLRDLTRRGGEADGSSSQPGAGAALLADLLPGGF